MMTTQEDYQARIQRAIYWLEAHQDQEIQPADLAKVAAFSVYHFHRVFRGVTGESVMECLRRLRLERAARSLRHSKKPVLQVALEASYQSHEGFTRAFRQHFGQSPRQFRKSPASPRMQQLKPLMASSPSLAPVKILQLESTSYLCARYTRPFDAVQSAWGQWVGLMEECDPGRVNGAQLVGRYFDDPDITPPDKQRFDVGMVHQPGQPVPQGCFLDTLPSGKWAMMEHRGSYDTLTHTYLKLIGYWFPQSSYYIGSEPCLEFYVNNPQDTAPDDLITQVWAPIDTTSVGSSF